MSARARSPVAFGPYVITRRMARGGMAEIYRARTRTGPPGARWAAIKMMRPSLGHEDLRARLFSREAKIASMLDHDNVVPLYAYGTEMGRPYLAMEYVHGRDLSHLVKNERRGREIIPVELGIYIGFQAAAGLGHAHRAIGDGGQPLGIVHRDVSPGNVMVGYDGSVKVLDFGVARMNEMQGFHTQTGTLRGKFAYMSPEQTIGEDLDARSDVFSLGTVLYELLTGSNCFRSENPISTLEQVQGLRPVPPSRANRAIPKEVDKILARCLAKDRRRRFKDGEALCQALGEFLDARRFDGRSVLADHMGAVFAWEKHEEESELQREEEEVALLEVVDFALVHDESGLDAKNVKVSLQEEASQSEVKNVSRPRTDESRGVFAGDSERLPSIFDGSPMDVLGEGPHQSGERVEVSSLLAAGAAGPATRVVPCSVPSARPHASPPGAGEGPGGRSPSRVRLTPRWLLGATALILVAGGVVWGTSSGSGRGPRAADRPTIIDPVTITVEMEGDGNDGSRRRANRNRTLAENHRGRRERTTFDRAPGLERKASAARAKRRALKKGRRGRPRPTGFLNVAAKPWGEIRINGERWPYQTPQANIKLPVGKHRLTLHCPDTGVSRSTVIHIKSGASKTVTMDLTRAK